MKFKKLFSISILLMIILFFTYKVNAQTLNKKNNANTISQLDFLHHGNPLIQNKKEIINKNILSKGNKTYRNKQKSNYYTFKLFGIKKFYPRVVGNMLPTTFYISGYFGQIDKIELRSKDTTLFSEKTTVIDSGHISATFNLTGVHIDFYDLFIINQNTDTLKAESRLSVISVVPNKVSVNEKETNIDISGYSFSYSSRVRLQNKDTVIIPYNINHISPSEIKAFFNWANVRPGVYNVSVITNGDTLILKDGFRLQGIYFQPKLSFLSEDSTIFNIEMYPFDSLAQIMLSSKDTTLLPVKTTVIDSDHISATFNWTGVYAGFYDMLAMTQDSDTLKADSKFLFKGIDRVIPNSVSVNERQTNIDVSGGPFSQSSQVRLQNKDTVIVSHNINYISSNEIKAAFNWADVKPDIYDVSVITDGDTVILKDGFRLHGIYFCPKLSIPSEDSTIFNIEMYPFDSLAQIMLCSKDTTLLPVETTVIDSGHISAMFYWTGVDAGFYDMYAITQDGDTLRAYSKFSCKQLFPVRKWVSVHGDTSGYIYTGDMDTLFAFIKTDYSRSIYNHYSIYNTSDLSLQNSEDSLIYRGHFINSGKMEIDEPNKFYHFNFKHYGNAKIMFSDSPDSLVAGEWSSGEILSNEGKDWKKVEVPVGAKLLYIKVEYQGNLAALDVYYNSFNNYSHHWCLYTGWGAPLTVSIPNPPSGTYYIRYWEHGQLSRSTQQREYMIYADIKYSDLSSPYPLSVTNLSITQAGQGKVSFDINGLGFNKNDSIFLKKDGNVIAPYKQYYENSRKWVLNFDLSKAQTGVWNLMIQNSDTVVTKSFTINPADTSYNISGKYIGNDVFRIGRWQTIVFEVTNHSNIDAYSVPFTVDFHGHPDIYNDTLLRFPHQLRDSLNVDWKYFGKWKSWADVPFYYDYTDSVNNIEGRYVPLTIYKIPANGTVQVKLKIKYNSYSQNNSVSCFWSQPSDYNNDGTKMISSKCAKVLLEIGRDVLMEMVPGGSLVPCAASAASAVGSLIEDIGSITQGKVNIAALAGDALLGQADLIANCAAGAASEFSGLKYVLGTISVYKEIMDLGNNCVEPDPPKQHPIQPVSASDPEDKYGVSGVERFDDAKLSELQHFINKTNEFNYHIDFWNKEDATAPVAEAYIRDTLDNKFDLSTFNFTNFGFLRWNIKLGGGNYFNINIDMRPDENYFVNVEGILDPKNRVVSWTFRTLDPSTMKLPEDPTAGFLPPIDDNDYNKAWVDFSVKLKNDSTVASETVIENQAYSNFDSVGGWCSAPLYGPFTNTLDFDAPESNVLPLDNTIKDTVFNVSWEGDDGNGSGISYYDIYVSENKKPYEIWKFRTQKESAKFIGQNGNTYRFYSIAVDKLGNREKAPTTEDASVTINLTSIDKISATNFRLYQNKPNPVTGSTTISFDIPYATHVTLEIINEYGILVEKLLDKHLEAGHHAINWKPKNVATGLYYYRLSAENYTRTKKLILIR